MRAAARFTAVDASGYILVRRTRPEEDVFPPVPCLPPRLTEWVRSHFSRFSGVPCYLPHF